MSARFIGFILLLLCFTASFAAEKELYVVSKDGKYGMCDAQKKEIIKPLYYNVEQSGAFCIATSNEGNDGQSDIYSRKGKLLLSTNIVVSLNDTVLVAFSFKNGVCPTSYKYCQKGVILENVEHPYALIVSSNGVIDSLHGLVCWYDQGQFILDSGGYKGVYDVLLGKYLMPLQYSKVIFRVPFFLASNDSLNHKMVDRKGVAFTAPSFLCRVDAVTGDGQIFVADSGWSSDHASYYTAQGRLLYSGEGRHNIFKSLSDKPSVFIRTVKYGNVFLDTYGRLIPEYTEENTPKMQQGYGDISITIHVDTPNTPMPERDWQNGIFNTKTKKYILKAPDRISMQIWKNNIAVFTKVKGVVTGYDGYGNEVQKIPEHEMNKRDYGNYIKDLMGVKAFRSSLAAPFSVYNSQLTYKMDKQFTDVLPGCTNMEFVGKWNGHWGVYRIEGSDNTNLFNVNANGQFIEVLSPVYDTIMPVHTGKLYHVTKGGRSYWLDGNGHELLGGKDFALIADSCIEGKRLAFDVVYPPQSVRVFRKVMIVDGQGKTLYSLVPRQEGLYREFYHLQGDRILCCTWKGKLEIWHARTGVITELTGIHCKQVLSTTAGPIALIGEDDKEQEGVYSLLAEKMIIPFGKYPQLHAYRYNKTSLQFHTNPYTEKRIIAIYDENGLLY